MNNKCVSKAWSRAGLFLGLFASSALLIGCGGDGKSSNSSSSATSSVTSSYAPPTIPDNGTGIWPSVKVSAVQTKTLRFEWSAVPDATYYRLLKDPDGKSGYTQVGDDITGTSVEEIISAHLQDWINAKYLVEACNANGCASQSDITFTATEMLQSIGYLKASNIGAYDWFGWSVALSGDGQTLAVGAPAEDSNAVGVNGDQTSDSSKNSGAVYVFVKDATGAWTQQAYLKASNTEQPYFNVDRVLENDRFGYAVALSDDGNTLAVSAILEDSPSWGINCNQENYEMTSAAAVTSASSAAGNDGSEGRQAVDFNIGAVYIFERTDAQWAQTSYVKPRYSIEHTGSGLQFGQSLALSGDGLTLAVGTTLDSMGVPANATITQFYPASANSSERACFEYYQSSSSSSIGLPVSSQSSTSAVSSSVKSSASSSSTGLVGGRSSGAVYTYIKVNGQWTEEAHIKASNTLGGDAFGASVHLSHDGNTLAVGAPNESAAGLGLNPTKANERLCAVPDGDEAVIARACLMYDPYGQNRLLSLGAAYVFERAENLWQQRAYIKPEAINFQTQFGATLALSGDGSTLAVGAPGDGSNSYGPDASPGEQRRSLIGAGAAYVYSRANDAWQFQAFIKAEAHNKTPGFGSALALNNTGNLLAVGAFGDESLSYGINGDDANDEAEASGAAFIFVRENDTWARRAYVKAPNTDKNDRFGRSISLSNEGDTLAVGAHRESSGDETDQDDNSSETAGATYLY